MNNLGLSICVSGYDIDEIQKAISRRDKKDFLNMIAEMFTMLPGDKAESALVYIFKIHWIKNKVLAYMQKQIRSAGLSMYLRNVIVEVVNMQLQIYCELGNVTCMDIYKIFFSYNVDSENGYIESVVNPMLRIMDETMPDEMKICLMMQIANNCRDGICNFLESRIKEECGIELSLEKLFVGIPHRWKGVIGI